MLRLDRLAVPAIFAALLAAGTLHAQPPAFQAPVAQAGVKAGAITLDGVLDEPEWKSAPVITLTQQSPHPDQPTPFVTTVRILRGKSHLYFGIACTDPDPSKTAIHTLQRDADQSGDDNVTIVLDTFAQKKLAYVFQVNAGGAMADGLISPGYRSSAALTLYATGGNVDYSWNGYWEAAVKRTATGWIAEIRINTQSLQFNNKSADWGLNISRYVPRKQLTLAWSGINLNAAVTDLQWEGKLNGVQGLNQGSGFEFDPYAVTEYSDTKRDTASWTGFDLKYNLTPTLAGRLTYHTDFSEAVANTQQVNPSPYSHPIPETRAFFLEGTYVFTFGHNISNYFMPFYSRSIGLINGETVPLNEGAKLLGNVDGWNVGVLDTQMAGTGFSNATNLFAGRAMYNVNDNWRIGTLVTNGDPTGEGTNTFTSFDSTWSTSTLDGDKNLNLTGWAARSSGSDLPAGTPNGYGFDVEYPNDLWDVDVNYNFYGDALGPALGFVERPGTKQSQVFVQYQPRPKPGSWLDWVRQFFFGVQGFYVTGLDNSVQSNDWFITALQFTTQSGWAFAFGPMLNDEVLAAPYPLLPSVAFPVGDYRYTNYTLMVDTPQSQPLSLQLTGQWGGLYDGQYRNLSGQLNWASPGGHLSSNLSGGVMSVRAPTSNGVLRYSGLTVGYSFTPNLTLSALTQYNNLSHNISENAILQWNIQPGRILYAVWNHGLTLNPNLLQSVQTISGNTLVFKLQWRFF